MLMPEVEPRYPDYSSSSLVIVVDLCLFLVLLVREVEGHIEIVQYSLVLVSGIQWAVMYKI